MRSRIFLRRSIRPAALLAAFIFAAKAMPFAAAAEQAQTAHTVEQLNRQRAELAQVDVRWIAARTGWAATSVPTIETRSAEQLSIMFFGSAEGIGGVRPLALYSRTKRILYLSNNFAPDSLADRSILLHELVHHLQIVDDVRLDCREEAEAQAYSLQIQWLREQGVGDPYALLGLARDEIDTLRCP